MRYHHDETISQAIVAPPTVHGRNTRPCFKPNSNRHTLLFVSEIKVSVPMELCLTVQKSGTARKGDGPQPLGHWQQLTKIVRDAHRPVVFEVDGLVADTRYSEKGTPSRLIARGW